MSKSKSKGGKEAITSDVMTKVKKAVANPVDTVKGSIKEDKKSKKKVVKEPTPETSDSSESEAESEAADSSDEDSDEDESEVEAPVTNGKSNGVSLKQAASDSDASDAESDDSSDSSDSFDGEATTNGAAKVAAPKAEDIDEDSDDSESDEEESDEETTVKKPIKGPVKATELSKKLEAKVELSDEDSDDAEEDSDESGSSEGESDEDEVKTKSAQPAKRKAEDTESPFAKKTKMAAESNEESKGGNLFVGNLSWNVDEAWLTSEFEGFGELSGVRIITDRDTGRSKGFGYVEFVDAAAAAKAFDEMKGHELDGRVINVDFAAQRQQGGGQDRTQSRAKSFGDTQSPPSDTLFVGNLSFDVGQDTVSEAFGEHGTIMGVRLPTDRETGQPKGFGYVTFASVEEAQGAMEAMQGYELSGRTVRLDYSQPRPQNGDSPGRGRGGFGGGRGRGGFDRGGRGGGRGGRGGFGDRGGRGGRGGFSRGASTNRGGFGDYKGKKTTF